MLNKEKGILRFKVVKLFPLLCYLIVWKLRKNVVRENPLW